MRNHLRELLSRAIEKTAKGGELNSTELPPLSLEPPKQREFGDLASNVAMLWAKSAKKPPRVIAETILKNIADPDGILARKEIAGPGFLNFTFSAKFYFDQLRALAAEQHDALDLGHGQKIQVEFASVNPTGPLHVGHGRVAVIGDVLARFIRRPVIKSSASTTSMMPATRWKILAFPSTRVIGNFSARPWLCPRAAILAIMSKRLPRRFDGSTATSFCMPIKAEAVDFFRQFGGEALLNTIRLQLKRFRHRVRFLF